LKPAAARRFIPFVKERFPHLSERIDAFYAHAEYAPHAYDERMERLFDRLRTRYRFPIDHERYEGRPPATAQPPKQLSLGSFLESR